MKKKILFYVFVLMIGFSILPKAYALTLNSATDLSGGASITSEDENKNVLIKYGAKTLKIDEADPSASKDGRPGGSAWLGFKITKPTDASADAIYWNLDADGTKSKIKKFSDYADDGHSNELSAWSGISFDRIYEAMMAGNDTISRKWIFDWDNDGKEDQTFTVEIKLSDITLNNSTGSKIYPLSELGSVRLLNPTSATLSNDKSNFVTVKYNDKFSLEWVAKDDSIDRPVDGWWVGLEITAPAGYDSNATFKTRRNDGEYSDPYKFVDEKDDGKDVMSAWVLINEEYLRNNETITFDFVFDWNNDGEYEQTITEIIPTANVTIKKDGEVVDPNKVEEPSDDTEVPNTFDGIALYFGFGMISLIGLVGCVLLFRKKMLNK